MQRPTQKLNGAKNTCNSFLGRQITNISPHKTAQRKRYLRKSVSPRLDFGIEKPNTKLKKDSTSAQHVLSTMEMFIERLLEKTFSLR
ncbi:hypothetical protein CEXT_594251 [Caerostris extrusa]|uniref:Uncharacterized protein n=1 Tax=Caerostris extrusa TaxID=172846 RepID=A0AAV4VIZ8_CAEEX|nr:hypothetical protein CEXT_594251 [Caerostris extrusa]